MFEEPKGSGIWYKIQFYEGPREIVDDENGVLAAQGDVVQIEIDDLYWRNHYPSRRITGQYGDEEREKLISGYFVSRTLHDLVIELCDQMDIDRNHARNLMVPLSDMYFSVTGSNEEFSEGLEKEAKKLEELINRLQEPGIDPNKRKKGVHKRDYFPSISGVQISTGSVEKISKTSLKRVLKEDTEYEFKHDAILRIFQGIFLKAFTGEQGDYILSTLASRNESWKIKAHIENVYRYILNHALFKQGHLAKKPNSIHNDACIKTGFLIDVVKAHYKWEYSLQRGWKEKPLEHRSEKENLIADLEQDVTQDLAKRYYHIIKSL